MVRNTGEVLGFFDDVQVELYPLALLRPGYKSSVDIARLDQLEKLEQRLKPPAWPSVFPAIDETKRSAGQRLFAERCEKCRAHLDREDLTTHIMSARLCPSASEPIRGWPAMPYADSARTGSMIGAPRGYLALAPLRAARFHQYCDE